MAVVSLVTGILDGIGLSLVAPTVEFLIESDEESSNNQVLGWIESAFNTIGIDFTLGWTLAMVGIIMTIRSVALLGQAWIFSTLSTRFESELRINGFRAIMRAGWPHFLRQRSGNITNALTTEAQRAGEAFGFSNVALGALISIFIYVGVSFAVSWQLTLSAMAATFLLIVAFGVLNRFARSLGRGAVDTNSDLVSTASEGLDGAKIIKGQALEDSTIARFSQLVVRRAFFTRWLGVTHGAFVAIAELAFIGLLLGGLLMATKFLDLPPSALTLFVLLFFRLFQRARVLQTALLTTNNFLPAVDEIRKITNEANAQEEKSGGLEFERLETALEFRDVTFGYESERTILKDLSLTVPAKSIVALVGPSGAGKTSIVDLSLGLLRPDHGEILLNGTSMDDYDIRSWRSKISYVSQETILFHGTITENIIWGLDNVTTDELETASRLALADEFIAEMPDGYATVVGDRGVRMSGGQRQRIALARAFLRKPELLVLDEATSELDTTSEAGIQKALEELRADTTILMIAHRFSTVAIADTVYVVDDGEIVEQGTMSELISQGGTFSHMYNQAQ